MDIGTKIKNLRVQKNLTLEELGERTDLSKGYLSQLENNLSSPSIETLFTLLEVLGETPSQFFNEQVPQQKVVYTQAEWMTHVDEERKYQLDWLVPESNENTMEPVLLTFASAGSFKTYEPSLAETFAYVLKGSIQVEIGSQKYRAKKGEAIYFHATAQHHLYNIAAGTSQLLLVATESYL